MPPRYTPRSWHLLVVALIALLDLGVLYMVLRPNVTDDYRAYYIDRTASCFPRITSGYYPLGQPISFVPGRNGYDRDTVRWCGFMPPNSTGMRSFGDYGILKFSIPLPDDDLLLTFSSFANTSADKPRREVKVLVNGQRVGTLVYVDAKRVNGRIVIPQRVAKAGGKDLSIRFEVPRIGPPGTNSEPVTLQLRLEALRLTPLGNTPPAPGTLGHKGEAGFPPPHERIS